MVATECVDRIATMKQRTGVIWDLTPTDVGWATGARTKARGVVHLLTMDQRRPLVMGLVLVLLKTSALM